MKRKILNLSILCLLALGLGAGSAWGQPSPPKDSTAATDSNLAAAPAAAPAATPAPLSDSAIAAAAANAKLGQALFLGETSLLNGGPSCISCHNVTAAGLPAGGLLAKDLTHVYGRLGEAGLPPILNSTPFPAMATAYAGKPLSKDEVVQLTAFFKQVEETVPVGEPAKDHSTLLVGGSLGACVLMGLIFAAFFNRKRNSVKQAIYARQQH